MSLVREKVAQSAGLLAGCGFDVWLTFVRETTETGDPVLPLILGQPVTWQSAFIVAADGTRIAIVGKYEDDAVRSTGAWTEVIPYIEGIRDPLRDALARLDPLRIGINYSANDVKADGLGHGLYLVLRELLEGTPYVDRLVSAEALVGAVRGIKTPAEIERIRAAIATTDDIFRAVADHARPGRSESDISRFMHDAARSAGVGLAWEAAQCPIVNTGPDSMVGHGLPSPTLEVTPGRLFHLDFGVRRDDYCSDVQRVWYVPRAPDDPIPEAVQRGFDAVRAAIEAAAAVLRPGALGHQVDEAARSTLVNAGYPAYGHATGHQVGRAAHDGGAVLGPCWPRYGDTPMRAVRAGEVYTLELGIEKLDGGGYLGLEEMVVVREDGVEWLTQPQTEIMRLGERVARVC